MHEHLDAFGIINMNGRVYDPLTAMFFSPDPVLYARNWLSYNRYAYAYENPFKYTDPDGNNPLVFIAIALVGGGFNLISNISKIDSFEAGLGYFLSGAGGAIISVFNPAAGGTFTTIGNTIMDVATGHLPDFSKPEQILGYVGGKVLDGFGAAGIGQMGKQIAIANGWLTSVQATGSFTKLGTSITSDAGISGVEVTVTATKTSGSGAAGVTGQAGKGVTQNILKETSQYTKSNLKLGQEMHKAYHPEQIGKEFRLPSGRKIDYLDISNQTIYELKPYNPRAIKAGEKQLYQYLEELKSIPMYKDFDWKLILELY